MPEASNVENEFLAEITALVEKNISNEQFGVSELADAMNMSRSNLLRKVRKTTNLSVSQLISQVRLKKAFHLLKTSSLNISEVSHEVGFNSPSYFIKCFREFYGYPPGEIGKHDVSEVNATLLQPSSRNWTRMIIGAVTFLIILTAGFIYFKKISTDSSPIDKSIAVLPFKNESNDSTNVYLINGLMESTLNNLQKIKDLKVISRTSSEKYRNTLKSVPEMAKELNVNYIVEGSGQKIGSKILLNIQLIEATTDKHLWAKQYRREATDIFELQQEVAKNIAEEIEVIITPDEEQLIGKRPTNDIVAYDYFLKGRDLFYQSGRMDLENAIVWFNKAIDQDPNFALAYASATMVYYYLDLFRMEKKHTIEINAYSDKAMLLDPSSAESLIAKGLAYADRKEFKQAVPYFEKALKLVPQSGIALHFLTEFYAIHDPNPRKYLEYAIKKVKNDESATDSITIGFNYMHLADAFMQCGFFDEASKYMDISLKYDPNGFYSRFISIYIQYSRTKDLPKIKELFLKEIERDTNRFDLIQEVGKICFMMRDYKSALAYYKKFDAMRRAMQIDLFRHENLKIGATYAKMGLKKESEEFLRDFMAWAATDKTVYREIHPAMYYAYKGDVNKSMEHFREFAKQENFSYWILLLKEDPEADNVKSLPEFNAIMKTIEMKFWNTNKEIRKELEDSGLLIEKK